MLLGRAGRGAHGASEAGLHAGAGGTGTSTTAAAGTTVSGEKPQRSLSARKRDRTSTALDTLTSELETLKSRWESTSRNYKLSDRFEFERSPTRGRPRPGVGSGPAPSVSAPAPGGRRRRRCARQLFRFEPPCGVAVGLRCLVAAAGMVKGLDGGKDKENCCRDLRSVRASRPGPGTSELARARPAEKSRARKAAQPLLHVNEGMKFLACKDGTGGCNYGFVFTQHTHAWNLAKTACTVLDAIRFFFLICSLSTSFLSEL